MRAFLLKGRFLCIAIIKEDQSFFLNCYVTIQISYSYDAWNGRAVAKPGFVNAVGLVGAWGGSPSRRRLRVWGQSPIAWRFLQFFNKNNAFLCIFWPE